MLYFRTKPDLIFQTTLRQALELELQEVTRISVEHDFDAWEAGYGLVSQSFTPYSALVTIEQLLNASRQDTIYRLSDYHSLLIYECLKNYSAVHQDLASQETDQYLAVGDFQIREIDFQEIIDRYFWDTDFLFHTESDLSHKLSSNGSYADLFDSSLLMTDLEPHPMHLELIAVDEPLWQITEPHEFFQ